MKAEKLAADVVIVGAGPAGSTAAALLAQRGWDVLLLDRAQFPRDKTCGDGLTPRAIPVLDRLGLLKKLEVAGYQKIHGARTVAPSGAEFHMLFAEYRLGLADFGLVVPRLELDDHLRQHAVACGARFHPGMQVTGPQYAGDGRVAGVVGDTEAGSFTVDATLCVVATGANIGLLRAFGLLQNMPSGFNAIRGYFEGVHALHQEFEFYFDPSLLPGYAWVFPVDSTRGRANIGLGLYTVGRPRRAPGTRKLLAEFMARHPRLADARPLGPAKGYPIRTDFPGQPPGGPGYLLAGEALGLVHPVTGEGIDWALESAEMVAHVMDISLRQAADPATHAPAAYRRLLFGKHGGFFKGLHVLERLMNSPRVLNVLIGKSHRKSYLAHIIAGINLGVVSPWNALSPRTWWDILT